MGLTWTSAGEKERADLVHALIADLRLRGEAIVGVTLTPSAYEHGFALALPERVVMACPRGLEPPTFRSATVSPFCTESLGVPWHAQTASIWTPEDSVRLGTTSWWQSDWQSDDSQDRPRRGGRSPQKGMSSAVRGSGSGAGLGRCRATSASTLPGTVHDPET